MPAAQGQNYGNIRMRKSNEGREGQGRDDDGAESSVVGKERTWIGSDVSICFIDVCQLLLHVMSTTDSMQTTARGIVYVKVSYTSSYILHMTRYR